MAEKVTVSLLVDDSGDGGFDYLLHVAEFFWCNSSMEKDAPTPQLTYTDKQHITIYQIHVWTQDLLVNYWNCAIFQTTEIKNDDGAYVDGEFTKISKNFSTS